MADPKKPPVDDGFGEDPPATDHAQTVAEQALELERLRKELAEIKASAATAYPMGVMPAGDPNESYVGRGVVKAGKFVSDPEGEEMFWYRINLPPSGGLDIKLCGVPFFHGEQYLVDVNQLRSLREIVGRTWGHEESIRGSNENFYRKPTERVLRGAK